MGFIISGQFYYRVSFQIFEKMEVNGPGAHPLFVFLKKQLLDSWEDGLSGISPSL